MFRPVNIGNGRTVELNSDHIVFVYDDGGKAVVRLSDGAEYRTDEDYKEFLDEFDITLSAEELKKRGIKPRE